MTGRIDADAYEGQMADDVTLQRLDDQIGWYDKNSSYNQRFFKTLKIVVIDAVVPVAAGLGAPAWLTGGLGVVVVIAEGVQQLNQYDHNWVSYRSTAEALKHQKYLYLAKADVYAEAQDRHMLLAERVEALVSREHAKWVSRKETKAKPR